MDVFISFTDKEKPKLLKQLRINFTILLPSLKARFLFLFRVHFFLYIGFSFFQFSTISLRVLQAIFDSAEKWSNFGQLLLSVTKGFRILNIIKVRNKFTSDYK